MRRVPAVTANGRLAVWLLSVCLITGCGEPTPHSGPQGSLTLPITDGQEDPGHPAVGLLLIGANGGVARTTCTATLVGRKTLLTAAHCLHADERNLFQLDDKRYEITQVVPHPSWSKDNPYRDDIGLARLSASIATPPAEAGSAAPTPGMAVTLVGFGRTTEQAEDTGTKRHASNTVAAVALDQGYFTITGTGNGAGNSCLGDSGGPVFATVDQRPVVVGIISAAESPCGQTSYHVIVQRYRSWLFENANGDLLQPDSTAPAVRIERPAAGARTSTAVRLEVEATDNLGVVTVAALVDGVKVDQRSDPPYQFMLTLSLGRHALEARASDLAGNSATATVQIEVLAAGDQADGGPTTDATELPDSTQRPSESCQALPAPGPIPLPWLLLIALVLGPKILRHQR